MSPKIPDRVYLADAKERFDLHERQVRRATGGQDSIEEKKSISLTIRKFRVEMQKRPAIAKELDRLGAELMNLKAQL